MSTAAPFADHKTTNIDAYDDKIIKYIDLTHPREVTAFDEKLQKCQKNHCNMINYVI